MRTKNVVFWIVIIMAAFLLWQVVKAPSTEQKVPEISYSQFLSDLDASKLTKAVIRGQNVSLTYRDGSQARVFGPVASIDTLETLRQKNVDTWFRENTESSITSSILNLLPLVLLAALWFFMIRYIKRARPQPPTA